MQTKDARGGQERPRENIWNDYAVCLQLKNGNVRDGWKYDGGLFLNHMHYEMEGAY